RRSAGFSSVLANDHRACICGSSGSRFVYRGNFESVSARLEAGDHFEGRVLAVLEREDVAAPEHEARADGLRAHHVGSDWAWIHFGMIDPRALEMNADLAVISGPRRHVNRRG